MRKIKFRGWTGLAMIYMPKVSYDAVASTGKIMQFTGLHDKHGQEIYEGDIVIYHHFDFDKGEVAEVKFGSCGVSSPDGTTFSTEGFYLRDDYGLNQPQVLEVIDNKFENPKLLK